jgi:hypothetical protein
MSCFSKKNTPYSLLIIQQSECIIRAQKFVNRVSIKEEFAGDQSDSVDVTIRVLDSWSTRPQIAISTSQNSKGPERKNFFWNRQQFDYRFTNRKSNGTTTNNLAYTKYQEHLHNNNTKIPHKFRQTIIKKTLLNGHLIRL